jgi:osmotically-inducible protein OsmY
MAMRVLPFLLTILLLSLPAVAQDVDDAAIVSRVERAIANDETLTDADIHITSVNGYVLLTGQALNADQKQQASIAVAFATDAMRRLINELAVVDTIDTSFQSSDAALTDSINTAISDLTEQTTVVVHDGTVHLLGRVSREQGNTVAQAVSKIAGVKTIRLSFEFTD